MSKVVVAVFSRAEAADAAVDDVYREAHDAYVIAHTHGVHEEEMQMPGTLAMRTAIVTGLLVGALPGFVIWAVLWPQAGVALSLWGMLLMVGIGALFGMVAGAVAGAAECKPNIAALAEHAESHGETVVTVEVPKGEVAVVRDVFERAGAIAVEAA